MSAIEVKPQISAFCQYQKIFFVFLLLPFLIVKDGAAIDRPASTFSSAMSQWSSQEMGLSRSAKDQVSFYDLFQEPGKAPSIADSASPFNGAAIGDGFKTKALGNAASTALLESSSRQMGLSDLAQDKAGFHDLTSQVLGYSKTDAMTAGAAENSAASPAGRAEQLRQAIASSNWEDLGLRIGVVDDSALQDPLSGQRRLAAFEGGAGKSIVNDRILLSESALNSGLADKGVEAELFHAFERFVHPNQYGDTVNIDGRAQFSAAKTAATPLDEGELGAEALRQYKDRGESPDVASLLGKANVSRNDAFNTSIDGKPVQLEGSPYQHVYEEDVNIPALSPQAQQAYNDPAFDQTGIASKLRDWVSKKDDGPSDGDFNAQWQNNVTNTAQAEALTFEMNRLASVEHWLHAYHGRKFTAPINAFAQYAIKYDRLGVVMHAIKEIAGVFTNDELDQVQQNWFDPMAAEDKTAFYDMAGVYSPQDWRNQKGTRGETSLVNTIATEVQNRVDAGTAGTTPIRMGRLHTHIQPITSNDVDPLVQELHPHWSYEHGCKSYSAVNQYGHFNLGLDNTGSSDGNCRHDGLGQTYTRVKDFGPDGHPENSNVAKAIMYAQYFPKDHVDPFGVTGHRHDWEEAVVFVDHAGNPLKAALSAHGDYPRVIDPVENPDNWDGNRVKIQYTEDGFSHALKASEKSGAAPTPVDYDKLSKNVQTSLNTDEHWFEPGSDRKANFPMGHRFDDKIDEALRSTGLV